LDFWFFFFSFFFFLAFSFCWSTGDEAGGIRLGLSFCFMSRLNMPEGGICAGRGAASLATKSTE